MQRSEITTRSRSLARDNCDPALKQKRRQSDAKWRANIATCYYTLRQIIERGKKTKKKKISKAMILDEAGKHLTYLENTVKHLMALKATQTPAQARFLNLETVRNAFICKLQAKNNASKPKKPKLPAAYDEDNGVTYVYMPNHAASTAYTPATCWSYNGTSNNNSESTQSTVKPAVSLLGNGIVYNEPNPATVPVQSRISTPLYDHCDYTQTVPDDGALLQETEETELWDKQCSTPRKLSKVGFTPVKLSSPWQLSSEICQAEENLLCKESLEFMDLSDNEQPVRKTRNVRKKKSKSRHGNSAKNEHKTEESENEKKPRCRRQLERSYPESGKLQEESDHSREAAEGDLPQLGETENSDREAAEGDLPQLGETENSDSQHFDGYCFFYRQVAGQLEYYLEQKEVESVTMSAIIANMWKELPEEQRNTMVAMAMVEGSDTSDDLSEDLKDVCISPIDEAFSTHDEDTLPYALDVIHGLLKVHSDTPSPTFDDNDEDRTVPQLYPNFVEESIPFAWSLQDDAEEGTFSENRDSPMLSQVSISKLEVPTISMVMSQNEDTNDHVVPQMRSMDIDEGDNSENSLLQLSPWRSIGLIHSITSEEQ